MCQSGFSLRDSILGHLDRLPGGTCLGNAQPFGGDSNIGLSRFEGGTRLFPLGSGDRSALQKGSRTIPFVNKSLMLGLSTLRAARKIKTTPDQPLVVHSEKLKLPRADYTKRIAEMEAKREKLADSLRGTFLNLDTFLPLATKYSLAPDFPSLNSYRYLHERQMKRGGLEKMDTRNRAHLQAYIGNIRRMEQITRINTNLRLLKRHQANGYGKSIKTIEVEVAGLRLGDFLLTTFPGEITVPIGLNIKKASPHDLTFVAGYTNGYIYYAPTAQQMKNTGGAQEDSDCLLAPQWQKIFETKAGEIIGKLLK